MEDLVNRAKGNGQTEKVQSVASEPSPSLNTAYEMVVTKLKQVQSLDKRKWHHRPTFRVSHCHCSKSHGKCKFTDTAWLRSWHGCITAYLANPRKQKRRSCNCLHYVAISRITWTCGSRRMKGKIRWKKWLHIRNKELKQINVIFFHIGLENTLSTYTNIHYFWSKWLEIRRIKRLWRASVTS